LHVDDGSGAFLAIVAECKDFTGLNFKQILEDATNQDSPNGFAEKIPVGLKEVGDLTFQCNLLDGDASQLKLRADSKAGTKRDYRLVFPKMNWRFAFSGFVADVGAAMPIRGIMTSDVTITPTGEAFLELNT